MKVEDVISIWRPYATNMEIRDGYAWADGERLFHVVEESEAHRIERMKILRNIAYRK